MITQIDTNLWRGPRPDSMDELKSLGIRQIINLEVGWFELFHGLEGREKDQAFASLISYDHVPISDWMFPTQKELDRILTILRTTVDTPPNGRGIKTYIHCLHGQDRTGLVCAIYRVKVQRWGIERAIQEMIDMGFHQVPYEWLGWIRELREYLG